MPTSSAARRPEMAADERMSAGRSAGCEAMRLSFGAGVAGLSKVQHPAAHFAMPPCAGALGTAQGMSSSGVERGLATVSADDVLIQATCAKTQAQGVKVLSVGKHRSLVGIQGP